MNLESAPNKEKLEIVSINESKLMEAAMRFGIEAGEIIYIVNKLPGGPIVIQKKELQIAIGRDLAKEIQVRSIDLLPK